MSRFASVSALATCVLVTITALESLPAHGQEKHRVQVAWEQGNEAWSGLRLVNTGSGPYTIVRVTLNHRADCTLKPIILGKVNLADDSTERLRLVTLVNSSIGFKGVLLDERDPLHPSEHAIVRIQVGEKVLLARPAQCGSIIHVLVQGVEANLRVPLDRPYTGDR